MVRSQPKSEEFKRTKQVSFELYKKYQMAVHDDKEDDLTMKQVGNKFAQNRVFMFSKRVLKDTNL